MLVLGRKHGECIVIGDTIRVQVVSIIHGKVKLGVIAPPEVPVHREEVYKEIQAQKAAKEAAKGK